jgi:hypothetical protein
MDRSLAMALAATLVMAALPGAAHAQQREGALPVAEMATVTGQIRVAAASRSGGPPTIEIDSPLAGRYRIRNAGLGAVLIEHAGEEATLVGTVEWNSDGEAVLVVERLRLHGG